MHTHVHTQTQRHTYPHLYTYRLINRGIDINTFDTHTYIHTQIERCTQPNGYLRLKWKQRLEFEFWTKLFAFHFAQMRLEMAWMHLFSSRLASYGLIEGQTGLFRLGMASSFGEGKHWIQTSCDLFNKVILCHIWLVAEGLGKQIRTRKNTRVNTHTHTYMYIYIYMSTDKH